MLKKLIEARAALKAKLEALHAGAVDEAGEVRSFTADESTEFDSGVTELRALDERIQELQAAEVREAAASAHRVTIGAGEGAITVTEPNPVYRKGDSSTSFFRDLWNAPKDDSARARLQAAQETRALTTTAGAGGELAPPLWLTQDFIALARAGRVTADLMNQNALPGGVSSINLPKIATGVTTAVQATQNSAVSNTDLATTSVTSGISTIAGQQVVSTQLLAQSGVPFDQVILADLAFSYAASLDAQVLYGTGANGQLRGLKNGASVGSTTYTSTTPAVVSVTSANSFYNKIVSAQNDIHAARYLPAEAIVMHPRRWNWVLEALDSSNRPLVVPTGPAFNAVAESGANVAQGAAGTLLGLPVYVDPNIPTNIGTGTNQDVVYVLRPSDCWLYETPLVSASFEATYAYNMSVLYRVSAYAAFIPDRFGPSVNAINGTGLTAPTL